MMKPHATNKSPKHTKPTTLTKPEDALAWLDRICQQAKADQDQKRVVSAETSSVNSSGKIPILDITDQLVGTGFQFITPAKPEQEKKPDTDKPKPE